MSQELPYKPFRSEDFTSSVNTVKRARLVRDSSDGTTPVAILADRFALHQGEMYRISYAIGGTAQRRVSRSVAIFGGQSTRRRWGGDMVPCLDFSLPHGRTLSLLADQLVDVRTAELNDRGQWVLTDEEHGGRRRRGGRRTVQYRTGT